MLTSQTIQYHIYSLPFPLTAFIGNGIYERPIGTLRGQILDLHLFDPASMALHVGCDNPGAQHTTPYCFTTARDPG